MTRILLLLTILIAGPAAAEREAPIEKENARVVRVMSFNIRNSNARDGANHWMFRRDLVAQTIRRFEPDLLGTQEVLADQFDELGRILPDYVPVGVARDDGQRAGEWSAIFYRSKRFEPIDTGNFWLSENPEKVGPLAWDAACVRICTWAKLKDRVTGIELVHANTHFDHKGKVARLESAKLIGRELARIAGAAPVILTGDFNCNEDNDAYQALTAPETAGALKLVDAYRRLHPNRAAVEATFHGFKGTIAGSRIDWILHSPAFKPVSAEIVRTQGERHVSDHYPVTAVLELAR